MVRAFFILICLVACFKVSAQYGVEGKILNSKNEVIDGTEVIIINKDSVAIQSTIIDSEGYFLLKINKGKYNLQVRHMGVILLNKAIDINSDTNFGNINVEYKSKILDEVVVDVRKKLVERKVDRLVFNIENSVSASGKDVYSALMVTPGVRVTNDQIEIIGKSTAAIMIDDRLVNFSGEDLSNFLKSMSADDLSKIEIITAPPSKYEAQGNSGIINLKYKKGTKNSWNSSIRSAYTQTTYPAYSLGGNFNYQKNKLSLSSNLSYYQGSRLITDTNIFTFQDQVWNGNQPRKVNYQPLSNFRSSINYKITNKVTVGIQYLAGYNKLNISNNNNTVTVDNFLPSIQDYSIVTSSKSIEKTPSHSLNAHADIAIDSTGKKVSFNLDYFSYRNNIDRVFDYANYVNGSIVNGTYNLSNNVGEQTVDNYAAKVDVETPLKWASFSYGAKISFVTTNNDIKLYDLTSGSIILDSNQSNLFMYDENTQAIYGSINKSFKEKWMTQFGLRFESTQNKGVLKNLNVENSNNYAKVFPTFYLTYAHNENNSFSFNFSRRIERPSFEFLNPFRIIQNQFSYVEGNPFLQPSYSDNIEMTYVKNQKWINTIYFSKISDGFQQIAIVDPNTNIQQIIPLNYYKSYKVGLNESYTYNKFSFWESVNALDINYSSSKALVSFANPTLSGFNSNISTSNSFILNKKKTILAGVNYWHSLPGVYDVYKTGSGSSLDLSLSFLLLNKDMKINVDGNDLFSGQRIRIAGISNGTGVEVRNYYDTRNFKISVVYKFGNKKIVVEQRDFGNEAEKSRVKN